MPIIIPDEYFDRGATFGVMPGITGKIGPTYDFATDSWEKIKQAVKDGIAKDVYAVGDEKVITLTDNTEVTLRIANLEGDLYEYADGSGWTGFIVDFKDILLNSQWNTVSGNSGGYPASYMCLTTIPAITELLPADLSDIVPLIKVRSTNNDGSALLTNSAKLYLPTSTEVFGDTSVTQEAAVYRQWAVFANDPANIIKHYNGAAALWWLRTISVNYTNVPVVADNGQLWFRGTTSSFGVSPAFCL